MFFRLGRLQKWSIVSNVANYYMCSEWYIPMHLSQNYKLHCQAFIVIEQQIGSCGRFFSEMKDIYIKNIITCNIMFDYVLFHIMYQFTLSFGLVIAFSIFLKSIKKILSFLLKLFFFINFFFLWKIGNYRFNLLHENPFISSYRMNLHCRYDCVCVCITNGGRICKLEVNEKL